jgi:C1A family cysteine protease
MNKNNKTCIDISSDHTFGFNSSLYKKNNNILNIPKFHWVKDRFDKRDYKYELFNNSQKDYVDLREFCSPIEHQGNLGSCTGQAIAGAIELLNKRNNKPTDVSRLFIYYYERLLLGTVNYDSGAYIRDGIKVCSHNGSPLEHFWPYIINRFKIKPNQKAINDALSRKITLYERVNDHEGCIDAINNGYPVIIGFYVYSSFISNIVARTGMMPYPNINRERFLGGHAVLLVGYNKKQNRYIVRNSWGQGWGDKGYFYMPFDVIANKKMSLDFWVIKTVNNP